MDNHETNDKARRFLNELNRKNLDRRWFLGFAASLSTLAYRPTALSAAPKHATSTNPFCLGVASGDPCHDGMVLWTRLAPSPLQPGGGMPPEAVNVTWEIATDDNMRSVVRNGVAAALPQLGHSVHVEVAGLKPDRWYYYRFRYGDAESPMGRTRTLPEPGSKPERMRFAFTSCQSYEQGLYTAYQQMAMDEPDLVIHLGDYIYEYSAGRQGKVRSHQGQELETLDDYRIRYAQYRMDPLLQHMHAQCPWLVTWDDHEVDNNWANDQSEQPDVDPVDFLYRRANAFQAYYEMMPLRSRSVPRGSDMRLYRKISYGQLADFMVLDTRQYRTPLPNAGHKSPLNEEALDSNQSILGRDQRNWLCRNLIQSDANWNVLAQQVMMGLVDRNGDQDDPRYSMDQWPGYAYERGRMLEFIRDRSVPNPIVLTGDIHSNWVNELRVDDRIAEQSIVATEFVGTSLTSGGNGHRVPGKRDQVLAANPGTKFFNAERGYVRCDVSPDRWQADYMVTDDVVKPGGTTSVLRSFVVEDGRPGVQDG